MAKRDSEQDWQYAGRMVDLAERIIRLVRQEVGHIPAWYFAEVAQMLGESEEDVRAACKSLRFTAEFHVRDTVFFAKSREEIRDDLDWFMGTGHYGQGHIFRPVKKEASGR